MAEQRPMVRRKRFPGAGYAIAIFYVLSVWLAHLGTQRTPPPKSVDAPSEVFAEARALHHVANLTAGPGGGGRLVSHPSIDHGIAVVLNAAKEIVHAAADRNDITVHVELQSVSGALHMFFLDSVIGNAYQNLSNIIVTIEPKERATDQAVLIGSHYDSLIGSPGASDDGSQVGVMLEVARTIASDRSIHLLAPLVFLFNGGEETFSQAAHGFMTKYDRPLGAFINLESTGPGGPDFVFQHTGGWTVAAYARAAKHPRGAVVGQDIFESGLVPADSDFRMFSSRHLGKLPGLDIAFLLDGTAYHTDRDVWQRLRPGTLQAMGENLVAAAPEFARQLAKRQASIPSDNDSDDVIHVFFDLYGLFMVVYSQRIARFIHSIPLAIVLGMPLLSRRKQRGEQVVSYSDIARGAAVYTGAAYAGIIAPVLLGFLRVLLFGKPMVWYSDHRIGFLMYMPAAAAAMLSVQAAGQRWMHLDLATALLGMAAAVGTLAAFMTSLGLGSASIFAMWGTAALLGIPAYGKELRKRSLATALALAWVPVALTMPVALLLTNVLMDKTSMLGVLRPPLGPPAVDAIIGALMGCAVVLAAGCIGIWFVSLLTSRQLRVVTMSLLVVSITTTVAASFSSGTYTVRSPKRILLQHTFVHPPNGTSKSLTERLVVGGSDVNLVEDLLDLANMTQLSKSYRDWQCLYPLTSRLDGVVVAPEVLSQLPFPQLPALRLEESQPRPEGGRRLSMVLDTGAPCWGVLNFSGSIDAWSFAQGLPHSAVGQDGTAHHAVRIAGNGGSRHWSFWVDAAGVRPVRIEAAITYWQRSTAALDKFVAERLPPWTTVLSGVTLLSDWSY